MRNITVFENPFHHFVNCYSQRMNRENWGDMFSISILSARIRRIFLPGVSTCIEVFVFLLFVQMCTEGCLQLPFRISPFSTCFRRWRYYRNMWLYIFNNKLSQVPGGEARSWVPTILWARCHRECSFLMFEKLNLSKPFLSFFPRFVRTAQILLGSFRYYVVSIFFLDDHIRWLQPNLLDWLYSLNCSL